MDFQDLIRKRFSVRAYSSDPVEDEKLARVLEVARLAPTAANRQPFRLIVVHTEGREDELRRIYNKDWFVQAPLVICACGVPEERWVGEDGVDYLGVDIAIVMDHLILAATEEGLGTCWIGAFNKDVAREVLHIPEDIQPIVFTPLGYPAETAGPKVRRPQEDFILYEQWE
jgi:nitroreductase